MNSASDTTIEMLKKQFRSEEKTFSPQLAGLKKNAFEDFERLGLPGTRNEEWKYTNVAPIFKNDYVSPAGEFRITKKEIESFQSGTDDIVLVFENGRFNSGLSTLKQVKGVIAGNISDYHDHAEVKKHLGTISQKNESFIALNTAMFQQGAFIFAEENFSSDVHIQLLFVNDARLAPTIIHPRNLIVLSPKSSLKISESYYSIDSVHPSFCNPVTEIFIGENANLSFTKVESENENDFHIDSTGVVLRRNSVLNINTITLGGSMIRNSLRIELQQDNASAYLNGLYITSGSSHVDNHSVVDHASPNCYSNEFYKGILDGKSHGVFNGKIFVRKDAQKTNAYQSNKNIILSDNASMNAKPQLEIYADDVKCSHGATTGQLDPEAMFYLRSRGIGENESRALLTTAFAEEILDRISVSSIKEKLADQIHSKLSKGDV